MSLKSFRTQILNQNILKNAVENVLNCRFILCFFALLDTFNCTFISKENYTEWGRFAA